MGKIGNSEKNRKIGILGKFVKLEFWVKFVKLDFFGRIRKIRIFGKIRKIGISGFSGSYFISFCDHPNYFCAGSLIDLFRDAMHLDTNRIQYQRSIEVLKNETENLLVVFTIGNLAVLGTKLPVLL